MAFPFIQIELQDFSVSFLDISLWHCEFFCMFSITMSWCFLNSQERFSKNRLLHPLFLHFRMQLGKFWRLLFSSEGRKRSHINRETPKTGPVSKTGAVSSAAVSSAARQEMFAFPQPMRHHWVHRQQPPSSVLPAQPPSLLVFIFHAAGILQQFVLEDPW